jgi:hypothetical protein
MRKKTKVVCLVPRKLNLGGKGVRKNLEKWVEEGYIGTATFLLGGTREIDEPWKGTSLGVWGWAWSLKYMH